MHHRIEVVLEVEAVDDADASERAASEVRDLLAMLDPDRVRVADVRIKGAPRHVNRGLRRFARRVHADPAYDEAR
jgi:hypothetical protein